jgi:hypothetical protein
LLWRGSQLVRFAAREHQTARECCRRAVNDDINTCCDSALLKGLELKNDFFNLITVNAGLRLQQKVKRHGPVMAYLKRNLPAVVGQRAEQSLHKPQRLDVLVCEYHGYFSCLQVGEMGTTLGLEEPLIMNTLVG